MKFPVRFVTIAICLTFVACALVRETLPLVGKAIDLRTLNTIHEIQGSLNKPKDFKL